MSAPAVLRRPAAAAASFSPPPLKIDVLRGALFVLIALSVCRAHEVYSFVGALHPGLVCVIIAVLACFMDPKSLAKDWHKRWPVNYLLWITVAVLFSIVFGISQGSAALSFKGVFSKVLVAIFLIIAALRTVRDMWVFVWAYVAGSAVLAYLCLFKFGTVTEGNGIARLNADFTWDANDVGLMCLIGLSLCFLAFRTSGKIGKLISFPVALGLAATIAKTGSRGAFVALTIVLLAFLVSLKGTSVFKRVLFVVAIAVGGAFAAPEGYFKQMNTVTNAKEDYNWDAPTGRRQVWLRGLGYIAQYPIFGVGYANFGRAEGQISERAKNADPNGPAIKWSAAHNTYLQAIAEIGIPGGLLVCAIVFGAITIPWKLRSRIPAAWKTGTWDQRFMFETAVFLPLATLGFAVSAFFLSFAFLEPLYYLGALAGALAVFVERELRAGRAPQVAAPRRPRYGAVLQQPPVMIPAGGAPQRVYVATPMRLQGQSGPTPK